MLLLNRRKALLGGAAAFGITTLSQHVLAARKTGPGGFSQAGLAKIPETLGHVIDSGAAIGLVTLLYRHGEIAQVNTLGMQDRESNAPMKRNTVFRIASMSKPVTVVAALTLIEQGRFALMDPIDKWIPEFANPKVLNDPTGPLNETHPASRGITVLDLMTQRSGLAYNFTSQGPLAAALTEVFVGNDRIFHPAELTVDDWLKRLSPIPLAYDPGTHWLYGHSTDVLGALVSRVSGMSLGDYLKTAIFDPLGMHDTGFWMPAEKQTRIATVYGRDPQTGARTPVSLPVSDRPLAFGSGGGGLLSTADDYLRFARMLLGKGRGGDARILSHRSVGLMTTNWLTPEQRSAPTTFGADFFAGQGFGLNLAIIDDPTRLGPAPYASRGSFSWPGAYGTSWQVDPVEDMINVYMVQNNAVLGPPSAARTAALNSAIRPARVSANAIPPVVAFTNLAYEAIDD
jgi:CubicO group peptidase (beta-lactamase class C family)